MYDIEDVYISKAANNIYLIRFGRIGNIMKITTRILFFLIFLLHSNSVSSGNISPIHLDSHFAVYQLALQESRNRNISTVQGRLVIEIINSCQGYAQTQRMIMELGKTDGKNIFSDSSHSTWESHDGNVMRFTNQIHINGQSKETHVGRALRSGQQILVTFELPQIAAVKIDGAIIFPTEHFIDIIKAAQQGNSSVNRRVYDGTGPDGLYDTTAVISEISKLRRKPYQKREELKKLDSWWVNLAYFSLKKYSDVPEYEIGFQLYQNGIITDLLIDYSTFAVKAVLTELNYIDSKC